MIYVTSDLHGYPLDKFNKMLDSVGFSDNDFLYVLGDVIDRGNDGIKILKWLMLKENAQLILGNHEAMFLECEFLFEEITENSILCLTEEKMDSYADWASNGCRPTLRSLLAMSRSEINEILEYLRKAPLYKSVAVNNNNYILTHSGLGDFGKCKKISEYSDFDLLWTRPELNDEYYDDATVIFGHTPTLYYDESFKGKAIKTGTWIDIDVGAGMGLAPMLLRLDDMNEFYFE